MFLCTAFPSTEQNHLELIWWKTASGAFQPLTIEVLKPKEPILALFQESFQVLKTRTPENVCQSCNVAQMEVA